MKPEEWLAVAARALGLFWLLSGLANLLDALLLNLGYHFDDDAWMRQGLANESAVSVRALAYIHCRPRTSSLRNSEKQIPAGNRRQLRLHYAVKRSPRVTG